MASFNHRLIIKKFEYFMEISPETYDAIVKQAIELAYRVVPSIY
mgnify:CR=1 FL=1